MSTDTQTGVGASVRKHVLLGLLTVIPIWVTWLIVSFVFGLLIGIGRPAAAWLSSLIQPHSPAVASWLVEPWLQSVVAVLLVIGALYVLGVAATKVLGRQLLGLFDSLMGRVPLVQTIYGAVKKLLASMQQKPDGVQRVVLIDFPSPEMKTVGLVTRTLVDQDTGRELAAVYVPTTPNPTSGYLEIVPLDRVTSTNWTFDEAMTFIVSGGAVAPASMNYDRSAVPKPSPGDEK